MIFLNGKEKIHSWVMKIKYNFVLRTVAGMNVVFPLGADANKFKGLLTLNESGVMLFRLLRNECTQERLICALVDEYDVSPEQARADVNEFIDKLKSVGCIVL